MLPFVEANDLAIKVYGHTTYHKDSMETLKTTFLVNYRFKIHEPAHKNWAFFIGGSLSPDYDHFQNIIKMNTLTTFNLEF
jgi:hypothetical protein